ncbi:MAG: hypothetical protein JWM78_712 [Verrucomicrobiaceae bacterium]|nr:hypothetical protein [Verrucomicrobiaceae bacterium]
MAIRPFANFLQHAYVTTDIEQAKSIFAKDFGVKDYFQFDSNMELKTARGLEHAELRIALAFVGDLQIELIQPLSGPGMKLYQEVLPETGYGLKFHHFAYLVPGPREAWTEFRATVGNETHPIAIEGDLGFVQFLYLDHRAQLGHYSEYMWAEYDVHAQVPRN